jgi:hypothetical protein
MQDRFPYAAGDELPGIVLGPWSDADGNVLNLSAYTCVHTLSPHDGGADVTGFDGTCTGSELGFVTIVWAAGDLAIDPGKYDLVVTATENATSKQRSYSPDARPIVQIT